MSNYTNSLLSSLLEIEEQLKAGAQVSLIGHKGKISVFFRMGNLEILVKIEDHLRDALIDLGNKLKQQ